jgi:intraflagellar transport protein 172
MAHYFAIRSACLGQKSLEAIAVKISVALLRYTEQIPADKAFVEAGTACKTHAWKNMAFVFLNRFLDLYEAIEDGNMDAIDNSDFKDTDIPFEVPLPEKPYLTDKEHDEIKERVLSAHRLDGCKGRTSFAQRRARNL